VHEPQRNLLDYVENVWDPSPTTTVSKYDYTNDALARRTSVAHSGSAFGSNFTQTLVYNDRNELTGSTRTDNAALARTYAYDPIGNRAWSDANNPVVRTTYVTNNLDQYTQQHRPVGSTTWMQSLDYDEDGNLVHSWAAGDMNCDGLVNTNDIDAFSLALSGEAAYEAVYPNCDWLNGDTNGDGTVNSDDIDPFTALVNGSGSSLSPANTYVWDGENRLVEVWPTFPASTANPKKVNFAYDYLGRRVSKKVYNWVVGQWATTQKNGASALGLQRILGLKTYGTAWTWLHKLRRALVRPGRACLAGTVEVDETYWGGEEAGVVGRRTYEKTLIIVAAQQDGRGSGRIRLGRSPDLSKPSLHGFIAEAVAPGSIVVTDSLNRYAGLPGLRPPPDRRATSGTDGQHAAAARAAGDRPPAARPQSFVYA
jgi:hypothetical protein